MAKMLDWIWIFEFLRTFYILFYILIPVRTYFLSEVKGNDKKASFLKWVDPREVEF